MSFCSSKPGTAAGNGQRGAFWGESEIAHSRFRATKGHPSRYMRQVCRGTVDSGCSWALMARWEAQLGGAFCLPAGSRRPAGCWPARGCPRRAPTAAALSAQESDPERTCPGARRPASPPCHAGDMAAPAGTSPRRDRGRSHRHSGTELLRRRNSQSRCHCACSSVGPATGPKLC